MQWCRRRRHRCRVLNSIDSVCAFKFSATQMNAWIKYENYVKTYRPCQTKRSLFNSSFFINTQVTLWPAIIFLGIFSSFLFALIFVCTFSKMYILRWLFHFFQWIFRWSNVSVWTFYRSPHFCWDREKKKKYNQHKKISGKMSTLVLNYNGGFITHFSEH